MRVGDEEKGTAAAEGQEEPGWAEVLEFAISGEVASREDEEIVVRVWDHHWVSPTACWNSAKRLQVGMLHTPGRSEFGSKCLAPQEHSPPDS